MLTNGQLGQLFMQQCSFLRLSSGSPPHLLPLQLRGGPIRCCFIRDTLASLWVLLQPGSLLSFCDFDAFDTSRGCQRKRHHFALFSFENEEEQAPFLLMAKRATGDGPARAICPPSMRYTSRSPQSRPAGCLAFAIAASAADTVSISGVAVPAASC